MQPVAVVKHGYILQYILLGFIASLVVSPLDPFLLKATKEAFHNGIVPAVAFFLTIAPPEGSYKHNDLHLRENIPPDEPENAHSHLIAMMLGNSEILAVHCGALVLGHYQSILLLEMDGPRKRTLAVQVLGDK